MVLVADRVFLQSGEIAQKPVDTWQAELDQGREELEMNMATNANVVEQYNKRKAEVRGGDRRRSKRN